MVPTNLESMENLKKLGNLKVATEKSLKMFLSVVWCQEWCDKHQIKHIKYRTTASVADN